MAIICSALATEFTPAVGDFKVSVRGEANLVCKESGGARFELIDIIRNRVFICGNPVGGAIYRFDQVSAAPLVEAAQ